MRLCDFVNWELQMLNDKHIWKLLSEEEKKNYKPKIYDFVEWELQYFRDSCNFSADELEYFNLRSKQYTNQQIAIKMNVSESQVSKLARRVKNKITRVI